MTVGNSHIDRTRLQKFLGIYLDDKLTFAEHTRKISKKLSQGVGVIRKIKPTIPRAVLRQLFYSLIYSKFTYAITCYGSAYQNQIQRVKSLVNRALKLVLNRPSVTSELCRNERIFDFDMAYKYFCSINMYRILCLDNHNFLANKVLSYQTHHSYETRSVINETLTLPFFRRSKCKRSFLYNGINIWNELPLRLKTVQDDLNSFKKLLKDHILS